MGLFSGGSSQPYVPPMPATPPPAPTLVDKAVVTAAEQTKAKLAASGGFGGTMTTGGQGVEDQARVQNKTLLGA